VISPSEALALPTAQLTADELRIVSTIEANIDDAIRQAMAYRGIEIDIRNSNVNVIAELNLRFRNAGWITQWQAKIEGNQFNQAVKTCVGFHLTLTPKDEAYAVVRAQQPAVPASETSPLLV
jgi:hypothetical protein